MTRRIIFVAILLSVVIVAAIIFIKPELPSSKLDSFVGVTYCGNSVSEAKQLIDKVKGYSNLFVLQSGTLQRDFNAVNELGDYAVSAGLHFLPYFGVYIEQTFSSWLDSAKERWGDHLVGVYYSDEKGGKMLDDYSEYDDVLTGDSISKTRYGDIVVEKTNGIVIHYELNGIINLFEPNRDGQEVYSTYYSNGTVNVKQPSVLPSTSYQQLLEERPLKNVNEVAERFINRDKNNIDFLGNQTTVFSSDYALYWFDYQAGYDVMLSQIGWNISLNQQISLCRGAATVQNKEWGVVITWKYNSAPYLDSGDEIFNQLRTAYECGAKYFILFNFYEEGNSNPYGTLKDEHFEALENFWNDVVKNPLIDRGSIKAHSVVVLPENYGWGMRWESDTVWGVFKADSNASKLWTLLQENLANHGLNLDIVYDDSSYVLPAQYVNVVRNQD